MKALNIRETIGRTPHVRINQIFREKEVRIKLERNNPRGQIKDCIALSMIEDTGERYLSIEGLFTVLLNGE